MIVYMFLLASIFMYSKKNCVNFQIYLNWVLYGGLFVPSCRNNEIMLSLQDRLIYFTSLLLTTFNVVIGTKPNFTFRRTPGFYCKQDVIIFYTVKYMDRQAVILQYTARKSIILLSLVCVFFYRPSFLSCSFLLLSLAIMQVLISYNYQK